MMKRKGKSPSFERYKVTYCLKASSCLSRINGGSKTPPQNSAEAKKLGGGSTVRKSPLGEG
ncbi:hypothetical protein Q9B79_22770 [Bacillus sp. MHSD_36]|uniref:hypothetical protein n=1 Tax=unclassified Bacillus (in: firmicutes) TaxID=185979 RepID=UPI0027423287|nr:MULTISPECIES: hypothetical protein [unclassified Bacillus (in: firmicutes)]MDP7992590.1 hypothetical protein [Bacillus sp. MHSD_36]MDR4981446.1 hypothetical protein [Bacillus sp. MHSD_37]